MDKLVLVIDRDAAERRWITAILWEAGFQVISVATTFQAMAQVMEGEPTLTVMAEETESLRLHEVVRVMHRLTGAPVMIIGSGGMTEEVELLTQGGDFYLGRPFTAAQLVSRARMLVRRGEACWEGTEAGLRVEEPPEALPTRADGARPIGMRVLRRDEEELTRQARAAG